MERTLAIIKPEAVQRGVAGAIIHRLEREGFVIRAMTMVHLSKAQAEVFYAVHRGKPFFDSLTTYMSSGPIVAILLERDNAIAHLRAVMGATDPARAAPGTIRAEFGTNIEQNAIHGSDSPESAEREIAFFFSVRDTLAAQGV